MSHETETETETHCTKIAITCLGLEVFAIDQIQISHQP